MSPDRASAFGRTACCFCGETIAQDRVEPLVLSVMSWRVVAEAPDDFTSQNFTCHYACLRERVVPEAPMLRDAFRLHDDPERDPE